jgi:hypothetical protein
MMHNSTKLVDLTHHFLHTVEPGLLCRFVWCIRESLLKLDLGSIEDMRLLIRIHRDELTSKFVALGPTFERTRFNFASEASPPSAEMGIQIFIALLPERGWA